MSGAFPVGWDELLRRVRALPEERKVFLSGNYKGWLQAVPERECGCLVGQLAMEHKVFIPDDYRGGVLSKVAKLIHVPEEVLEIAEKHTDRYRRNRNDATTCRARYEHVERVLASYAGGAEVDPDPDDNW